jgi:hypothetical protein
MQAIAGVKPENQDAPSVLRAVGLLFQDDVCQNNQRPGLDKVLCFE